MLYMAEHELNHSRQKLKKWKAVFGVVLDVHLPKLAYKKAGALATWQNIPADYANRSKFKRLFTRNLLNMLVMQKEHVADT